MGIKVSSMKTPSRLRAPGILEREAGLTSPVVALVLGLVLLGVPIFPGDGAVVHLGDPLLVQAVKWNRAIGLRRLEGTKAGHIVSAHQVVAFQMPLILRFIESQSTILHTPADGQVSLHHVHIDVLVEVGLIGIGWWLIWFAAVLMC